MQCGWEIEGISYNDCLAFTGLNLSPVSQSKPSQRHIAGTILSMPLGPSDYIFTSASLLFNLILPQLTVRMASATAIGSYVSHTTVYEALWDHIPRAASMFAVRTAWGFPLS